MTQLLILFTGELTYDDSLVAIDFAQQLNPAVAVHLLGPAIPIGLWAATGIPAAVIDDDFSPERFTQLVSALDPDLILVADAPSMWANGPGTRVTWEHLAATGRKLAFLDSLGLWRRRKLPDPPPNVAVIEPVPPNEPAGPFAWQRIDPMTLLGRHGVREELRREWGIASDALIATVHFPTPQLHLAAHQGWSAHYREVVGLLDCYLGRLGRPYHLVALGMSDLEQVKTLAFPTALDLQRHVLGSDLFVTEQISHPSLVWAAEAGVPAVVLGNQTTPEMLGELAPYAREAGERLAAMGALFPYASFPFPSSLWSDEQPVVGRFRYFLADLLQEDETLALFERALSEGVPPYDKAVRARTAQEIMGSLTGSD